MNTAIFAIIFTLLVVAAKEKKCIEENDCDEGECCIYKGIMRGSVCKPLAKKGESCDDGTIPDSGLCECEYDLLACEPTEVEESDAIPEGVTSCHSEKNCDESECCIARDIFGEKEGVCESLAAVGEDCSDPENVKSTAEGKYIMFCPCAERLTCETKDTDIITNIGKCV